MFVKRNRSKQGNKEYSSVLLVQGERVPARRGPGRPPKNAKRETVVVHRTLANLSRLPEPLVALIDRYCRAEREGRPLDAVVGDGEPVIGAAYGPLAALLALARECGVERALGNERLARLGLFLVLARIAHRGSRLSAVVWAETQAVREVLGLGSFDEDDLYDALDWLAEYQTEIETRLAPKPHVGAVFLYDVTSSYLEGQQNELAAPGYNRDGKKHKKQIVAGLLTDASGEPVSVQVYEGNTSDPTTIGDQVHKLAERFGAQDVVLVGDRGMIKAKGKELLRDNGFRYITSLTDPEIRKALADGTLQLDLFDTELTEVTLEDGRRYVLRRNPAMAQRNQTRRADQLRRVEDKVTKRNAVVAQSPTAQPEVSLREAKKWLGRYKLSGFVKAALEERRVVLIIDEDARHKVEQLDGCYALVTDVPQDNADTETVWERYGDLQKVERDFRTMKTGLLELRPLFVRKATRTRGHAVVTMLALKIARALHKRVQPLDLTCQDALDRLEGVRLVTLADPALGLWRLPSRWAPTQKEVLDVLPPLPAPLLSLGSAPRLAT